MVYFYTETLLLHSLYFRQQSTCNMLCLYSMPNKHVTCYAFNGWQFIPIFGPSSLDLDYFLYGLVDIMEMFGIGARSCGHML